jgi:tRNA A-37 threonylcarbamoyl transferase component Bud32
MNLDRVIAVRNSKTVYRDGDICLKVFDESYSKAEVLNEALNQARVEETGLCIPKIREVTVQDGKWIIVSDYIKGKTLDRIMREDTENTEKYMQRFVSLQLEVQSRPCPLLIKQRDKLNRKIWQADFDATTRSDLLTRLESMPRHTRLCHGDFNPSNIIACEDGQLYILDWSHATLGNASADAARTYLLFLLDGRNDLAERYLQLFCEESGTPLSYVRKWMPIVAAAQSVEGNAMQRAMLAHWVNETDYE